MSDEKQLYWLVEINDDLSYMTKLLSDCMELIKDDIEGIEDADVEECQYTITPKMLTQKEYEQLDTE